MPLTCAFCKMDIQTGELVQPDVQMNLAHKTCVDRELEALNLKPTPTPVAQPVEEKSKHYKGLADYVSPSKPSVCKVCGDRCIAMCPACSTLVCQAYGWNGKTCSIAHEGVCSGARASRERNKPGLQAGEIRVFRSLVYHTAPAKASKNGKHKTPKKSKGKKR